METILSNISLLFQVPVLNAQMIIDGLLIGAVFALAAYGLALVWGVMNVKNLAQGDFVMVGGYIAWWLSQTTEVALALPWMDGPLFSFSKPGIHPLWGIPIAFVVMWGVGWVIYRLVVCKVIDRDLFTSLLATFGVAIVLAQLLNILFGSDTQTISLKFEPFTIAGYRIEIPDTLRYYDNFINIPVAKLIGFICAVLLAIAVILFMRKSRMGQAIRATAQDPRAARVLGIDTDRVYSFTFSLNAAICGAAGALIVMIWLVQPFYGITYSIRAFVVVTAAGFGNLPGVIAAGLGMGVIEQYGGFILGTQFQQAVVVGLLLLVLVIRLVQQSRVRQVVQ